MKFDDELSRLAGLLRVGATTARTISEARGRDEAAILTLATQAETMAAELDCIIGGADGHAPQPVATLRLRRER